MSVLRERVGVQRSAILDRFRPFVTLFCIEQLQEGPVISTINVYSLFG